MVKSGFLEALVISLSLSRVAAAEPENYELFYFPDDGTDLDLDKAERVVELAEKMWALGKVEGVISYD